MSGATALTGMPHSVSAVAARAAAPSKVVPGRNGDGP